MEEKMIETTKKDMEFHVKQIENCDVKYLVLDNFGEIDEIEPLPEISNIKKKE